MDKFWEFRHFGVKPEIRTLNVSVHIYGIEPVHLRHMALSHTFETGGSMRLRQGEDGVGDRGKMAFETYGKACTWGIIHLTYGGAVLSLQQLGALTE
jgi:hypothetical protein